MEDTIYAVCLVCGHVEPRPSHTQHDWVPSECCGEPADLFFDLDSAEDASEAIVNPAI